MPRVNRGEIFQLLSPTYSGERVWFQFPMAALEVQGLGMPPVIQRTTRAPNQHGETFLGSYLGSRFVQILLHLRQCNRMEVWNLRRVINSVLNPQLGELRFRVIFPDATRYDLHDVYFDSGFASGTDGFQDPSAQRVAFRLVARDPLWHSVATQSVSPVLGADAQLVFPITFGGGGILFGNAIETEFDLTVLGDWPVLPTIVITGPIDTPSIQNLTTGETITLEYSVGVVETVTISLAFGAKTVFNNLGTNLLSVVSDDSNFSTFHLDPDPLATNGVNSMRVTGSTLGAAGTITFSWQDLYLAL